MNYYEEAAKAISDHRSFASAVVVATRGSTPRHPGSKMIVYSDGLISGTVGGGMVEKLAVDDAKKCILNNEPLLKEYTLIHNDTPDGMDCSGYVTIFIEPVSGKTPFIICGAGHVAGKVIPILQSIGFEVTVIDIRPPEMVMERVKQADHFINAKTFENGLSQIQDSPETYYLSCAYTHQLDLDILRLLLQKKHCYIGMLGSEAKITKIRTILSNEGIPKEILDTVHMPVGLPIGGETPEEIAVSIAAEVIQVKTRRRG